jgi:hypothetical protein
VAEAAILTAMRPTEAGKYTFDIVENEELRRNFLSMKHQMAISGKVAKICTLCEQGSSPFVRVKSY